MLLVIPTAIILSFMPYESGLIVDLATGAILYGVYSILAFWIAERLALWDKWT
jgi:hypothetical protein